MILNDFLFAPLDVLQGLGLFLLYYFPLKFPKIVIKSLVTTKSSPIHFIFLQDSGMDSSIHSALFWSEYLKY